MPSFNSKAAADAYLQKAYEAAAAKRKEEEKEKIEEERYIAAEERAKLAIEQAEKAIAQADKANRLNRILIVITAAVGLFTLIVEYLANRPAIIESINAIATRVSGAVQ